MPEAEPAETERFWAIRKGLSGIADPADQQLYLDVTSAMVAALAEAAREGRGIAFEPLWRDP
jgi:hypothetical protein